MPLGWGPHRKPLLGCRCEVLPFPATCRCAYNLSPSPPGPETTEPQPRGAVECALPPGTWPLVSLDIRSSPSCPFPQEQSRAPGWSCRPGLTPSLHLLRGCGTLHRTAAHSARLQPAWALPRVWPCCSPSSVCRPSPMGHVPCKPVTCHPGPTSHPTGHIGSEALGKHCCP